MFMHHSDAVISHLESLALVKLFLSVAASAGDSYSITLLTLLQWYKVLIELMYCIMDRKNYLKACLVSKYKQPLYVSSNLGVMSKSLFA